MRSLGKGSRRRKSGRKRVGQVSYYQHHGGWHVYYRDGNRQVRRRAGDTEESAAQVAAQINAHLAVAAPTLFSFTPLSVPELRRKFLEHHEHVLRSTLATVSRYRAATQHLENFARAAAPSSPAHLLDGDQFVRYLRTIRIAPNGHNHSAKRPLRDKGIRFILKSCRSLYGFAAKKRHLPPYGENPFAGLGGKKFRVEDAKPVFVFDQATELRLLLAANDWSFPIHFILAKTGIRVGELVHLLVEDLDLNGGWLQIRNKPELGWRIKTGRQRAVPLIEEVVSVFRRVIGGRTAGLVFRKETFRAADCPLGDATRLRLAKEVERRVAVESGAAVPLARTAEAQLARTVWRDAGATTSDRIRSSFTRLTGALGLESVSCPKSWRHTFATLLQDANVDPLVRQLVLGHAVTSGRESPLGMTGVYTHTRPETLRREIFRALQLWPASLAEGRQWAGRREEHSTTEELGLDRNRSQSRSSP